MILQCGLYIYFLVWKVKRIICLRLRFSLKYSPDIFRWSKNHWSVESHISPLLAADLMFLLWNMDKRICRLCDGDPFKSVVESYLPFATLSNAKDERHICSQRVSSSRQDPFPLSSSSSDPHVSERCCTAAYIVITRVDELPVHPPPPSHLITPLLLRQLAWWEKKGWRLRDRSWGPPVGVCHSLGMVGWRKSSGLTHPDSSATGGGHAQRGAPTERSLLVIMALIKGEGGWNDFFLHL